MARNGAQLVASATPSADPGFDLRLQLSQLTQTLLNEWPVPQRTVSQYLRVPQPLVSRLKSGSTERISVEAFVNTLTALGVRVELAANVDEVAWRLRTLAQLDAGTFDQAHAAKALGISQMQVAELLATYRSRLR